MKKSIYLKIAALTMVFLLLTLTGCGEKTPGSNESSEFDAPQADTSAVDGEQQADAAEAEPAKYEFNPHLYVHILAEDIPQDYWDSFYNLCDALRAGEATFGCSSEEAYKWATDPATLNALFPAACMMIKGQSDDGSSPYENSVGRIYYQIPAEEFVERQVGFESMITELLNSILQSDDDEFEKTLKIFDYISLNYSYQYDFITDMQDGANYYTMKTGSGQCIDLAGVYTYLLLQSGVDALQTGCNNSEIAHEWVYVILGGKGYHSDVTWSLRSAGEELPLYYFLMTDNRRVDTGCAVDDLTAPLLPRYWVSMSSVKLPAEDDAYCFPSGSFLESFDETNKIVKYTCNGEECAFNY